MLNLWSLPPLDETDGTLPPSIISTVETIQFCMFCITVPLYTFTIYFIFDAQSRKAHGFSTPFYKLYLSASFIDLTTIMTNYFGSMFPKWGWGLNVYLYLDGIYTHTYYYIAWSVGINQAMCAAVLTANRVSAILFTHKYKMLWDSRNLYISYTLQFAPGMLLSILTFFNPTQLYRNHNNGIAPRFLNTAMTNGFFITGGVYLMSICIFLVGCYCYLFYVIRQRGRRNLTNHSRNDHSLKQAKSSAKTREFKLFIMSSAIVIVELLLLLLFLNNIFGIIYFSSDTFLLLYNVVCDVYSSINPYLLWICSDSLRDYILIRLGMKKRRTFTASVITINTNFY